MTPSEIAETLINGNVSDAREAILTGGDGRHTRVAAAVMALDVFDEMCGEDFRDDYTAVLANLAKLRRCLTGGT
jgi:hypothetical protein